MGIAIVVMLALLGIGVCFRIGWVREVQREKEKQARRAISLGSGGVVGVVADIICLFLGH